MSSREADMDIDTENIDTGSAFLMVIMLYQLLVEILIL